MKKISLIISTFFIAISAFAQIDEVKLIVSGTASTKEKATSIALRSAIEQAFGTFVSANTEIVKSYESNHGKDDYISKCMVRGCGRELAALAKCLKNMSKMLKEEAAN